jgi:hypothetical protein
MASRALPLILGFILALFAVVQDSLPVEGGPSAGERPPFDTQSYTVAVNVQSDLSGHQEHVQMPSNIKLTVTQSLGRDANFNNVLVFGIQGPPPWVPVEFQHYDDFTYDSLQIDAKGLGTVVGRDDVAVRFVGTYAPDDPFGRVLTGKYTIGEDREGATLLPGGEPIVYQIKPKSSATPTESTFPPKETPGLTGSINLTTSFGLDDPSDKAGESVPGFQINLFEGGSCVGGSPISSGSTDANGVFSIEGLSEGLYSAMLKAREGWNNGESVCVDGIVLDGLDHSSGVNVNVPVYPHRNGDVNKDGTTNSLDATVLLQHVAGLFSRSDFEATFSKLNFLRADVNEDGANTSIDVALILQVDAGFLEQLPVGSLPPAMPTATQVSTTQPTIMATGTPALPNTATPTDTPVPTEKLHTPTATVGKVEVTIVGGPSRSIDVFTGDGCDGASSPFLSLTLLTGLAASFELPPGHYSILAEDATGYELAEGESCRDIDVTAGGTVEITFTYQPSGGP